MQIGGVDLAVSAQSGRPFQKIPQLTHVARPGIGSQPFQRGVRQGERPGVALLKVGEEVAGQGRHVPGVIAQGRHFSCLC